MSRWLHFFPHSGLNNETFLVHHRGNNVLSSFSSISREIFEQFCDSLAHFVPYFWECCPSGLTTKINRKKPHVSSFYNNWTKTSVLGHSAKWTPLLWKCLTNPRTHLLWVHRWERPCGFPQVLNISLQPSKASALVNHPNRSSIMQSPIHNTQNVLAALHRS